MKVPQPQEFLLMWLGHFFCARFGGSFYLCMFRYFFSAILRTNFEEMTGCFLLKWNQHQKKSNGWPD